MQHDIVVADGLALRPVPGKGRGVFAARAFNRLEPIGVSPVLVLDAEASRTVEATALGFYIFAWPFGPDGVRIDGVSPYAAVAFGLLSLVNDAPEPGANAAWECNADQMVIIGYALRDIAAGEEIQWNYNWDRADEA